MNAVIVHAFGEKRELPCELQSVVKGKRAYVLVHWPLTDKLKFWLRDGVGVAHAKMWHVAPESLQQLQAEAERMLLCAK